MIKTLIPKSFVQWEQMMLSEDGEYIHLAWDERRFLYKKYLKQSTQSAGGKDNV